MVPNPKVKVNNKPFNDLEENINFKFILIQDAIKHTRSAIIFVIYFSLSMFLSFISLIEFILQFNLTNSFIDLFFTTIYFGIALICHSQAVKYTKKANEVNITNLKLYYKLR